MSDTWSTSTHDVIPSLDFDLRLTEVPTYLHAFLRIEDEPFTAPYEELRARIRDVLEDNAPRERTAAQAPRADISNQRLRTWKKTFEDFGFVHVSPGDDRVRVTPLGRAVREAHEDLAARVDAANAHVLSLVLSVQERHVLANPIASAEYPAGTDLHPYRAIWKAADRLDGRIHWEEINRVLMRVLRDSDLDVAIDHIAALRPPSGGEYDSAALAALGAPVVDDGSETRRRVTPWLAAAGVGGTVLVESTNGYWAIQPALRSRISELLTEPVAIPTAADLATREAYLAYLGGALTVTTNAPGAAEAVLLDQLASAAERWGGRKIIGLSGIPGTGKTRLARMLAARLTENDAYRMKEIQFHEGLGYEQFVEGFVPRRDGRGFELKPMTLREINDRAATDPGGRTHVLIIEEFTRADVHAVLGELLTYVEHRDRAFRLPLSQTEMRIAPNLVVIATMNPRDRSALTLDDAILRRLHQVAVDPDPEVLAEIATRNLDVAVATRLSDWYRTHADALPFGHGEFTTAGDEEDLRQIWRGTLQYALRDPDGRVRERYADAADTYPWR